MRVNRSKAVRRVAVALCVSWVIGCGVFAIFAKPSAYLSYSIGAPGTAPVRVRNCGADDGSRVLDTKNANGNLVIVKLCFKTLKAKVHRLGMEASYSLDVVGQMDALEKSFRLPPEGVAEAQRQIREQQIEEWKYAAIAAVSGLVAGWLLLAVGGWAARSGRTIPSGTDSSRSSPHRSAARRDRERRIDSTATDSNRVKRRVKGHRSRLD